MLLAQSNIALFRWPLDDHRMSAFVDWIGPVNQIAEQSDGFVWRFTGDYQPRGSVAPWNDPLLFFNLSVWRDQESLMRFVRSENHMAVMCDRAQWLTPAPGPSAATWWIEDDSRPSVDEAIKAILAETCS